MDKLEFESFEALEKQIGENKEFAAKVLNAVKGTETGKAYSDTIAKTYFDENKSSAHSHAWDMVDKALQGAGYEKPAGLKTSEWAANIAKEAKTYQSQLKALEGKGGDTEALKAAWLEEKAQLQEDYKKSLLDEQQKFSDLNNKIVLSNRKEVLIKQLAQAGEPNAGIDKATFQEISDFRINQLAKNATEENGKIIWNDAEGNPIKNGLLNADLDYVVNSVFGSLLQKGTAGGGAKGGQGAADTQINGSVINLDASKFNTGVEFMNEFDKAANLQGIAKGSDEYFKLYDATKEAYKVGEMKEI